MFIQIRGDNGFPQCPICLNCETEVCNSCEKGELFDPDYEDANLEKQKQRQPA